MKRLLGVSVPIGAALLAFVFGAIMILFLGESPIEGLSSIFNGAFGTGDRIAATAVRATPLLLVGAGITIAFRANVINIGGEGQIIAGALLSTSVALIFPDLPKIILLPLVIIAGMVGGGIWGAIPGALKAYASVNEILSTIMLNIVAVQLMNYLLRGPMIDPIEVNGSRIPQTERLSDNAALPTLISGTRLHLGVVIAVVAAIVVYIILWRTPLGFRLRAVGHNPDAARAAGISVEKNIVAALGMSGALSGLAGVVLVFGSESLRMVTDGGAAGFTGSAGFNGIVAALFGGLHPLWTVPSSFLFGALLTGATQLQRALQIPAALAVALNGLIVLFVVSSDKARAWLDRQLDRGVRTMSEFFTLSVLVATLASAIRLAVPYLLAALGETIGQRSGVLNLGVDGVMLLSAFGSYYAVVQTGSHMLGVLVGLCIGLFMGVVYGVVTVRLQAQQGISGIGIFLFGLGFSDLLFQELVGSIKPIKVLPSLDKLPLVGGVLKPLTEIKYLGEALFSHNLMTYLAFALVPVVTWMLNKTTFGLNIKAVGENPQAADSLGVSVERTRFFAILIGNALAGLAGATLSLQLGVFQQNLTNGLGFIAVALVYFGAWRAKWVMAGAMLYGIVTATRLQWQARDIIPNSASDLAAMAPALITILALVLLAKRVRGPAALTKPFSRH